MRWRRHRVLPQFATGTVLRLCVSARQDGFLMCTKQCFIGTVPNVVFEGLMVSRFLSCSSVSVNHFGLGSERGQLCVSWQWSGSACVIPCHLARCPLVSSICSYEPYRTLCCRHFARVHGYGYVCSTITAQISHGGGCTEGASGRRGQASLHWPRGFRRYAREAPTLACRHGVSLSGWASASNR